MTTVASSQRKNNDMLWLIGLGVLVVIGIVAWIMQLTQGLGVLGVNQAVAWGAYIAAFFLFAGAGSGLVILAALSDLGTLPTLKGQRRWLLLAAIASFVAAGVMILMDIGKPERVLFMLSYPNFKSMFVWDFYALALSVILAVVYVYFGAKWNWLPWLAALVALMVVIVEGWILSVSAATPLWHSALIPVTFVIEGLITAMAMVLLARNQVEPFGRIIAALLAMLFVLSLIELVTVSYGGAAEAAANLSLLVSGSLAPLYWGVLILGMVVPFVLLVWFAKNRTAVAIAAVLAVLGIFFAKLDLLVAGQALPYLGNPVTYMPTLIEVGGVIGMVGLAGLVFVLINRYLPSKAEA